MKHKIIFDKTYGDDKLNGIIEDSKLTAEHFIIFENSDETEKWLGINKLIEDNNADYYTYITNNIKLNSDFSDIVNENIQYSDFDFLLPLLLDYHGDNFYLKNSLFWSSIYADDTEKHGMLESELLKFFRDTPFILNNFEGCGITFKRESFLKIGGFKVFGGDRTIKLIFDALKADLKVYTSNKLLAVTENGGLNIFKENVDSMKPAFLQKWLDELLET